MHKARTSHCSGFPRIQLKGTVADPEFIVALNAAPARR